MRLYLVGLVASTAMLVLGAVFDEAVISALGAGLMVAALLLREYLLWRGSWRQVAIVLGALVIVALSGIVVGHIDV